MKSGTRRMWSRRVLRAGWLIAPIFAFPAIVWGKIKEGLRNFFFDRHGKFTLSKLIASLLVIGFIAFVICALSFIAYDSSKYSTNATNAELKEAAAEDSCVAKELAAQLSTRSIKRYDIERIQARCRDLRAVEEQYKALTEQREAFNAK